MKKVPDDFTSYKPKKVKNGKTKKKKQSKIEEKIEQHEEIPQVLVTQGGYSWYENDMTQQEADSGRKWTDT